MARDPSGAAGNLAARLAVMSKIREQFQTPPDAPLAGEASGDLRPFVVFTQLRARGPYIYAGWLEAADQAMAMAFAKEHYGQDQECVNIQVIPREAITSSDGLYGAARGRSPEHVSPTHPPALSLKGRGSTEQPSPQPSPTPGVGRGGQAFAVYTQKKSGDLWLTAGTVDADFPAAAIDAARKAIKQATTAHAIWVVAESDVISTHGDLIWRHTDQSYRLARGYGREVRAKWVAFRDEKQLAEYEKDDLAEAF